jgi:hypothetical protein
LVLGVIIAVFVAVPGIVLLAGAFFFAARDSGLLSALGLVDWLPQ